MSPQNLLTLRWSPERILRDQEDVGLRAGGAPACRRRRSAALAPAGRGGQKPDEDDSEKTSETNDEASRAKLSCSTA